MRIRFIWPGKTRDERLRGLAEEYLKRLSRFARCEVVEVKEARTRDTAALRKESRGLLEAVGAKALLVLLDLNGQEWSSMELAAEVRRWESGPAGEVAILIGGPAGVTEEIAVRAQERWRLSRLTLTHEMARVLVLEQVYRAYTINHGLPYQK
jgi:23S rRNA (pseudouridine1915-N3)-methyltransferase